MQRESVVCLRETGLDLRREAVYFCDGCQILAGTTSSKAQNVDSEMLQQNVARN